MISLDLMKSSEFRIAGDQSIYDITKFEYLSDKFSFSIQDLMLLTISLDLLKLYLYYTPICVQLKHLTYNHYMGTYLHIFPKETVGELDLTENYSHDS